MKDYWHICIATATLFSSVAHAAALDQAVMRPLCAFEKAADTLALQQAIDAKAAAGGGEVVVPAGSYAFRPFELKSGVTLRLEKGAVLLASTNITDYPVRDGSPVLIGAYDAQNVAIVGEGIIDGRGSVFRDKPDLPGESQPQTVPVMMRFSRCRGVKLEDFSYRNGAAWGLHLRNCDGVTVQRVRAFNHTNQANDGIDIESRNVLIDGCVLDTDDDALVFKSESDPSFDITNVVVRNCRLASCCNAIKFGTGSYGLWKGIAVQDCTLVRAGKSWRFDWRRPSREWPSPCSGFPKGAPGVTNAITGLAAIAIEVVDGGRLEDVTIRNIDIRDGYQTPLFIRMECRHPPQNKDLPTCLRNVLIENVRGTAESRYACSITGLPHTRPTGITLRNLDLRFPGGGTPAEAAAVPRECETDYPDCYMFDQQALPAWGFYIRHADDIRFVNVKLTLNASDARAKIVREDVKEFSWDDALEPLSLSALGFPAAPKGTEWESEQELGLNKLPPRAWFGHFPDVESAKGILMQSSPWHRFLDSEVDWRFKWTKSPKDRPVDFYRTDYDVSGWDVVKVPCSWQAVGIRKSLERYGMPLFLNQPYIWAGSLKVPAPEGLWPKVTGAKVPADWWLGPGDNPVGSYRRDFEVPADWSGKDVYLQFDGVESFFYLWVNGTYVGFSKNSRNAAAFDVTKHVKPGKNTVAVEVYRNSDGAYLEAQDIYRLSGIFRHVRLYCAPKRSIADAKISTKPSAAGVYDGDWNVRVDAEFRYTGPVRDFAKDVKPGCTISARLFDAQDREMRVGGVTSGSTLHTDNTPYWADNNFSIVKLDLRVAKPLLWSAEEPNLHTLVLELRDWEGTVLEAVGFQLGFRAVEIREGATATDRTFLFNGRPIKLKGVNRGECHPKYGHYVPDEVVLQDLKLIKQANMNHIRCSHFPQGEYFYYLCNKIGIYLMDEANVESHGYFYGDLSLSHREEWVAAHWDRVRAMYEWEKNNPSVILWSLGNEAGPGRVFKECYENLKGRDPDGRPINWERNNSLVDIGSRQYPTVAWVRDVAAGTNTVKYPYHINEYAHDRLSCPNDLKAYQDAIESSDRIIGAAIWDWADQALLKRMKKTDGGGEAWIDAFGGDWNEKPVEGAGGDGILEGVVKADRTPEPSYWEAKYAFQPYCITATQDGMVQIESKNFFVDSSDVRFEYRLMSEGRFVGEWKPLDLGAPIGPREKRVIALPDNARAHRVKPGAAIRFRAVQIVERNLIPACWVVSEDQLELSASSAYSPDEPVVSNLQPSTSDGVLTLGNWKFSKSDGTLVDVGMNLDAFRYPVGEELASYIGPGPNAIYRECLREGLRDPRPTLERFTTPVRNGADWTFETVQTWRGLVREDCDPVGKLHSKIVALGPTTETNAAFRTVNRWRVRADGTLDLDTSFERLGRPLDGKPQFDWAPPATWKIVPRLGWRFTWPVTGPIEYYGTGPWETYPHRKAGAFPAVWRAERVSDMGFAYTRNQDFGNRVDVRWVSVEEAGFTVVAREEPFDMAVTPWSPAELITHDHPLELPVPSRTILTVSAAPSSQPVLKLKFIQNKVKNR